MFDCYYNNYMHVYRLDTLEQLFDHQNIHLFIILIIAITTTWVSVYTHVLIVIH